jgi:toxin YoeB
MAQRKIIWSLKASDDLQTILEFYFQCNGNSIFPKKLLTEIDNIISFLPDHPKLGKTVNGGSYRVIIRGHYEIFYRYDNDSIVVVTIWDSRKNPENKSL